MEAGTGGPVRRWGAWCNALALLIAGWLAIAFLAFQVRPGATVVAVVFPPWWSADRVFAAVAASDAAIVRTTALATILVVRPAGRDGFGLLRQAGALFVADPQAISACLGQ